MVFRLRRYRPVNAPPEPFGRNERNVIISLLTYSPVCFSQIRRFYCRPSGPVRKRQRPFRLFCAAIARPEPGETSVVLPTRVSLKTTRLRRSDLHRDSVCGLIHENVIKLTFQKRHYGRFQLFYTPRSKTLLLYEPFDHGSTPLRSGI